MDLHEQRMQCLKMAFDLGGKPEAVLSAAQQLLDFLSPPAPTVEAKAEAAEPIAEAPAAAETVPDPIAACGTVLVMQEGGELADAVATVDPSPVAAAAEEAVMPETAAPAIETAEAAEPVEEIAVEPAEVEAAAETTDSEPAAETIEPEAEPSGDVASETPAIPAALEEGNEAAAPIN
jgi:hypothetical protein